MTAQPRGILDPAAGDTRHYSAGTQPAAMDVEVVTLVRPEFGGSATTRAADGPDPRDRLDHRLQHHRIVSVRGGDTGDQRLERSDPGRSQRAREKRGLADRDPVRVRDDVDLGAFLASIDRTAIEIAGGSESV